MSRLVALVASCLVIGLLPSRGLAAEEDPQVTDPCGELVYQAAEWADICSAGFRTLWRSVPREDDSARATWALDGLEITFRLAGGVNERPSFTSYELYWEIGECGYWWIFNRTVEDPRWSARLSEWCPDSPGKLVAEVADARVSVSQDRITTQLMLSEELASAAEVFKEGQRIERPWASVDFRVTSTTAGQGILFGGVDLTSRGRTFVIGEDRPPDPG